MLEQNLFATYLLLMCGVSGENVKILTIFELLQTIHILFISIQVHKQRQ